MGNPGATSEVKGYSWVAIFLVKWQLDRQVTIDCNGLQVDACYKETQSLISNI